MEEYMEQKPEGGITLFGFQKGRRCEFEMPDGRRCGSPAMRHQTLCYAHEEARRVRPKKVVIPPVTDSQSFQAAVREVMRGLLEGAIDDGTAGKLLYALQLEERRIS
jgi:hypothetical protein